MSGHSSTAGSLGAVRILAGALALLLAASAARADDAAAFYKGKVVKFIVSVGVGGGYDAYARMIAPHLAKALDATVIVENLPGAGGILALNQQMIAPSDGMRFTIINGTPAILAQILEQENLRYDLTKVDHLGIIAAEPWVWLLGAHMPFKTPAEAVASGTKIRWGGTGPTGGPSDGGAITCEALKLNCQIVLGFRGSAEIALAVQRGELDALYVSDASAFTYDKAGQVRAFATAARRRSKVLPDVPTMFEGLKLTPEQEWWLDFRASLNDLGRILVTAPGTQPDRLAYLRGAIRKVLSDPEVVAEGAKSQRFIDFRDAEEAQRTAVKVLTGLTPEQKSRVRDVVLKKYY